MSPHRSTHQMLPARGVYHHVVVLVPGFMGFGRVGAINYFADRASAAVRGALETRLDCTVPVVGVNTDPAGTLSSRQQFLLDELARIETLLGEVRAFHLVGHSTGGVDAELLTRKMRVSGKPWGNGERLRGKIGSVTTISAPHYGTCLVDSPAAGWLMDPTRVEGGVQAALLIGSLGKLTLTRSLTLDGLEAAALDTPQSVGFIWRLLRHRELVEDLRPERMVALRRDNPPDPELHPSLKCFVTVAPPPVDGVPTGCDGFFERMHGLTGHYACKRPAEETERFIDRLEHPGDALVIRNPGASVSSFGPETSDGVVNSARQLLETHTDDHGSALGGIVMGDHGDVLGFYDREDWLTDGTVLNHGFFRSGSGFGDDQFFALWDAVAEHVASVAVEA